MHFSGKLLSSKNNKKGENGYEMEQRKNLDLVQS